MGPRTVQSFGREGAEKDKYQRDERKPCVNFLRAVLLDYKSKKTDCKGLRSTWKLEAAC